MIFAPLFSALPSLVGLFFSNTSCYNVFVFYLCCFTVMVRLG